jgi:hypothetical protein
MGRAEVLQGVRQMRFGGLLERISGASCHRENQRRCCGCWSGRSGAGATGCAMRCRQACAIGGSASHRAAAEEILRLPGLYEERYSDFTGKHFHEQLPQPPQKRSINALWRPVNLTRQQHLFLSSPVMRHGDARSRIERSRQDPSRCRPRPSCSPSLWR